MRANVAKFILGALMFGCSGQTGNAPPLTSTPLILSEQFVYPDDTMFLGPSVTEGKVVELTNLDTQKSKKYTITSNDVSAKAANISKLIGDDTTDQSGDLIHYTAKIIWSNEEPIDFYLISDKKTQKPVYFPVETISTSISGALDITSKESGFVNKIVESWNCSSPSIKRELASVSNIPPSAQAALSHPVIPANDLHIYKCDIDGDFPPRVVLANQNLLGKAEVFKPTRVSVYLAESTDIQSIAVIATK